MRTGGQPASNTAAAADVLHVVFPPPALKRRRPDRDVDVKMTKENKIRLSWRELHPPQGGQPRFSLLSEGNARAV